MSTSKKQRAARSKPTPNGFIKIPRDVLQRKDLSATAKLLLGYLTNAISRNWQPGFRAICRDCGLNPAPVSKAIETLEAARLLLVERSHDGHAIKRNVYTLPATNPENEADSTSQVRHELPQEEVDSSTSDSEAPQDAKQSASEPEARQNPERFTNQSASESEALQKVERSASESETVALQNLKHTEKRVSSEKKSATRKRAASKPKGKKPKPDPRVNDCIKAWADIFQTTQNKPWIDGTPAKDRALIKKALQNLDRDRQGEDALELLTAAAKSLCTGGLSWVKGAPSIGLLSSNLNDLLPEPKQVSPRGSQHSEHPVIEAARKRDADDVEKHAADYRQIVDLVESGEIPLNIATNPPKCSNGAEYRKRFLKTELRCAAGE